MGLISFSPLQDGVTGVNAAATNNPLNTIYNDYNGNITDANIASNAAIAGSKIAYASISNPYKFSVYRNSAQNIGNGAFAVLQCDTKIYDTGSNVDIVTNKGRFTAPIAGFYQFNALVNAPLTGTSIMGISLFKNGARTVDGGFLDNTAFTNTVGNAVSVSATIQLSANDYVEAQIFGNSAYAISVGISNTTYGSSYFQGFLVSAT